MRNGKILISSARSGTNYFLAVYSKCFPEDFVVKEIFRRDGDSFAKLEELLGLSKEKALALVRTDPLALWKRLVWQATSEGRSALAKIFYYHINRTNPIWAHFRDNNKVIHVIRRNAFDIFVSREIAIQTGKWQEFGKGSKPTEVEPLMIDREELVGFLEKQLGHIEHTRRYFADADFRELFYEDIEPSVDICVEKICSTFDAPAPANPVSIDLRKQKSKTNREIVANYDEVAEFDTFLV